MPAFTAEIMNAELAATSDLELPEASVRGLRTGDDFDRDVWSLFGIPVDAVTPAQAVVRIEQAVRDRQPLTFTTPNVNILTRALRDKSAREELLNADLSLMDGAPLVAIARRFGCKNAVRCAGSDIFDSLRRRPAFAGRQMRVFFFGGRDGAAERAAAAINKENRGLIAVGSLNPGFGDIESMSAPSIIEAINAAEPDFVVVSLGAAKGHGWIERNRDNLTAPVVSHLGAVVDFVAGTITRAPGWVSRSGLEWLWRIKEEPTLWRRYWSDGVAFLSLIAAHATSPTQRAVDAPATAKLEIAGRHAVIRIEGDCVHGAIEGLSDTFRLASASGRATIIDLEKAGAIDAAFLGLVLMLEKRLRRSGLDLAIAGASAAHQRLIGAHKLPYSILEASRTKSGDASSRIAASA